MIKLVVGGFFAPKLTYLTRRSNGLRGKYVPDSAAERGGACIRPRCIPSATMLLCMAWLACLLHSRAAQMIAEHDFFEWSQICHKTHSISAGGAIVYPRETTRKKCGVLAAEVCQYYEFPVVKLDLMLRLLNRLQSYFTIFTFADRVQDVWTAALALVALEIAILFTKTLLAEELHYLTYFFEYMSTGMTCINMISSRTNKAAPAKRFTNSMKLVLNFLFAKCSLLGVSIYVWYTIEQSPRAEVGIKQERHSADSCTAFCSWDENQDRSSIDSSCRPISSPLVGQTEASFLCPAASEKKKLDYYCVASCHGMRSV